MMTTRAFQVFFLVLTLTACGPTSEPERSAEALAETSVDSPTEIHQDYSETQDGIELGHATDEQLAAYEQFFEENGDRHLGQVAELVAIPTLAMVPENAPDLEKAGQYLVDLLTSLGMDNAEYHPADGFPLVTAEWMHAEGQPTAVFYGHFDVQPVDASRWDSDPFTADIRDNKLYGRGATDDKGYIIAFLSTIEAMMELDGGLPINVKFFLDGSEEFGSQSMEAWLAQPDNNAWIREADFGFNLDAMMQSDDQGLMWRGLRGGGDVEVTVTSANTAVHSGLYGGTAPNAIHAAAMIIASMYNTDGSVAIEGFSDDLLEVTQEQRDEIKAAEPDMASTLDKEALEIAEWIGDPEFTPLERTWLRNSMDVTGIRGGYIDGKASIIAESAWFRVMTRTGPGQDPAKLNEKIIEHIKANTPWGVKIEFTALTAGSAPFFEETDLGFRIGYQVQTEFFGKEPKVLYVGGGVPALSYVPDAGGPSLVPFSFQRSDEGFHADNEYLRIDSFQKGQRAFARLLHAMVDQPNRD
jgi:acetylornithine deacetylase/succinyl-diaminopimelate desuccinylase-like protein